jgi:hypothetical protein
MRNITKAGAVLTAAALVSGAGLASAAQADTGTTVTVRSTDLISVLSDTRSAGHVTFLTDGLHVQTDDNSGQAKAAEYFSVAGALPDSASLTWWGTDARPGQQIVFDYDDIDGNGNDYNILVGEPIYGENWWLTNSSSADAKAADPSGAENGGNGSEWFGTLAQWKAAMPNARILAGGFSLGSGVKGDGVIDSITYGDTTYRFTNEAAPTTPAVANVKGNSTKKVGAHTARIDLFSKAQPADTTLGKKLTWRVKADGKTILVVHQGFGAHDWGIARFAKHSGKHVVDVYKNGVQVRHFAVRTH